MLASRIALLREGELELSATPREFLQASTDEARALPACLDWKVGRAMNSGLGKRNVPTPLEHLTLVLVSMAMAIAVAVPAGILITRRAAWRPGVMGFANVMQTIPSLALFGFLIPVPLIGGIGKRTAIVALVLYALLPILRNTLVGILGWMPRSGNPR